MTGSEQSTTPKRKEVPQHTTPGRSDKLGKRSETIKKRPSVQKKGVDTNSKNLCRTATGGCRFANQRENVVSGGVYNAVEGNSKAKLETCRGCHLAVTRCLCTSD